MAWHIVLFLCFSVIGVLLAFLFFSKRKGNRFANRLLGIYTLLFSFELTYNCLMWSGYLVKYEFVHFNFAQFPLWLCYGALVYIFVRAVLKNETFKWMDLFFLIPLVAIITLNFPFYSLSASSKLDVILNGTFAEYTWMPQGSIWAVILIMFFYGFLTYDRFGPSKNFGFKENKWLTWFVGSYLGFAIAFATYMFLVQFNIMNPSYDYFVDIVIVFFIGMLAFFGFAQPEIFEGKPIPKILPFIKYRKTGLSESLSLEMKNKLLNIMEHEKPYLENTLRLDDMAKKLNLSRNHTSQIINEHFNLSFFNFVNKYRVEEAKSLMTKSGGKATITQIAYDAGFNNRASFYKAFKKFEKQNPTEYINPKRAS